MISGKAFEYALLDQFQEKLKDKTNIEVVENSSFYIAKDCFANITKKNQTDYLLTASFAVNFLIDIEPRLANDFGAKDILQLEILSDKHGKHGDVRDVLAIRLLQKWEIGVSAKNNHDAVKHSRLSHLIDFGEKWLGINVSQQYFETITPIFKNLENLRKKSNATKKWCDLEDYHSTVYIPVLNAFITELKALNKQNKDIPAKLISYLIGNKDFYKVIKRKNTVEIQAYNLHGTLNLPFANIESKYKIPQLPIPTEIIDINFKNNSDNTVILTMDNDWILSFRIHNASSKVEASLKFDVTLLKSPKKLFKNTLTISGN